ncbi:MAG: hypothetical protein WAT23_05575, partial [Chromatiaceae bacterium]
MGPAKKADGFSALAYWGRHGLDLIRGRPGRQDSAGPDPTLEAPLRAELFSADQMEQHGLRLASADRLAPGRVPERLLAR